MDEVRTHDPLICGIDFHDSCPACQRTWLNDPERIGEVPKRLLTAWTGKEMRTRKPAEQESAAKRWKGKRR